MVEFRSPEIERLQVEIAQRLGFRLVGDCLELYGTLLAATEDESTAEQCSLAVRQVLQNR